MNFNYFSTNLWISLFLAKDTGSLPFCEPNRSFCTIKRYLYEFFVGYSPDRTLTFINIKISICLISYAYAFDRYLIEANKLPVDNDGIQKNLNI
ncbi:hypothetical protein TSAR_012458 [Trichomalopsis sarcophagae]|uniref:Uncharacterized protein n=1 Tax=Trichomalopsis sarcophagae TaxID=543379 RepID=A0A232FFL1_9HYME|nr:hypothetical protein TSAR_012458 [Trichomalopsis sarcophagae]